MNQENHGYGFNSNPVDQNKPANLPLAKPFQYKNPVKDCKHRTGTGFCTNSQRQCPATLFTIPFNN